MTVQNTDAADSQNHSDDNSQIDLRYYLRVIIAWWKEILLLAILAAVLAGAAVVYKNRSSAPIYRAVADIVVARLVSEVSLDERVSTQAALVDTTAGATARRGALAQLARTGAIAKAVTEELGETLPENRRIPANLLKMVEVEVPKAEDGRTPSDLIRITVTADNPEMAAKIANSWATHYIERANAVFGELPEDVIESVQVELAKADSAYQETEKEYEAFLAISRIDSLTRQINEKTVQRDNLQLGREEILNTIADQDRAARIKFFTDLTGTQTQALYRVLNEQSQAQLKGLSQLYADRDLALRYLDLARGLQEQIRLGGDDAAATNQQTLQFLKNQIYSLPESVKDPDDDTSLAPSVTFINGISTVSTAAELEKDIQALVTVLENGDVELDARINSASAALLSGEGFNYLDEMGAGALATSVVFSPTIGVATETQSVESQPAERLPTDSIDAAILRSYLDLLEIGGLVQLSQTGDATTEQTTLGQTIDQLERSLQTLQAEFAAESSREQQLLQKRDLAWNTYDALSNKVAELSLERSSAGREVRLGSPAILPAASLKQTDVLLAVVLAGIFGLLAGIVLALLADYLGYSPPFSKQQHQAA